MYLEGETYSPEEIARVVTFAEEGSYMRDYKEDPEGKIRAIDFRFVPDQK